MKKRVFFAVLALFSFGAFISCSNAAGGSDSANVQTSAASSSKKSGVVTLTGTVSVSGAVPQILSDNYDVSSDGGTSRSAQPGLDVSGESATMEYFATATCDGVVKNGVFGSGADAKKFGLELEAEKNWSIVVGVRDKTDPEKIYLESPAWGVTPDAADPTINHNFVPVPTTSGGKGNIKLKVEFSALSYTVRANFISGPSGVDLTALTLTQENDSAGKILTCDNVDSGVYEISIDFVTTTSKPILEYSTIQTVTVAKNMTTNAWARDGNESAASPISGGKFQFNSGNKDALIKEFLGSNIYVADGDGVDSSDTYSGNWKSPLKSVNAAVQKIKAAGDAGATAKDYVIHCSGTFNTSSYASTPSLTSAIITSTNSKSITIVGTSAFGADTFSASDAGVSAFFVDTTIPVKFKNITLRGASGIGDSYLAALDVKGGAQVTIEDNVTITGSIIGVSVDGATTSVKLNGGTIKNNTTAVQVKNGSFVVQKGSIPFNSATCSNDVKLDENKFITVKGDLSGVDVSTAKIGITPGQRKRGVKVVDTAASTATVADVKGKFLIADPTVSDTNPDGDEWEVVAAAADNALKTNAPIYVGQAPDGTAGSNDNAGTKSAPYAKIMRACQDMNDASMPYTINVKGTVSGSQTVSAVLSKTAGDGKSYHAASVLIKGVTPIPTSGVPQDSIDGGGASASALNIYPDVPVTIQNLKITKGGGAAGGGIYMSPGTDVTIKSGTLITANKATQKGGGIYCKDGTLKIEGGKICANQITGTSSGYGGVGLYAESSSDKSAVITMTGGEISGNKCENANVNGGGVKLNGAGVSFNMSGGAVKDNESLNLGANFYVNESDITLSGTAEISGGKIETTANDAIGAAMWLEGSSASLTMTGGKICGNTAKTTASDKNANAGVYVKASTFNMSGGEISGNKNLAGNSRGGAVRLSSDEGSAFVMKGDAFVPYGGTEGNNDVYLHDKKSIMLADSVSSHADADGKRVGVTVAGWKRGFVILGVSGSYSITDAVQKKFVLTAPATDEWEKILASTKKSVSINAPIYVGKKPGETTDGLDTNYGTKNSPFKTIARACQEMNDASTEYIININGSVSGAQTIPATLLKTAGSDTTKNYAKSVTLTGVADSGATLNGGGTSANPKTTLTVSSGVLVNIDGLTITGGYNDKAGGLLVSSGSIVNLRDGVKIIKNEATDSGGGVYVDSSAKLALSLGAEIGDSSGDVPASDATTATTNINKAKNGAGVYNKGTLLLGAELDASGAVTDKGSTFTGGVFANLATAKGGGVYQAATSTTMYGGNVKNNYSGSAGGGVYIGAGGLNMTGGTFELNKAYSQGGAVYAASTFSVSGGANLYADSNAEKVNDVYLSGTNTLGISNTITNDGNVATITPPSWTRGKQVLSDGSSGTYVNQYYTKFKVSDSEWTVGYYQTSLSKDYAKTSAIGAELWVSTSGGTSGSDTISAAPASDQRGTKAKPYSTMKAAVEQCFSASQSFTINVCGTVSGAKQVIPAATETTGLAESIYIYGKGTNASIDRGLLGQSAKTDGTALEINSTTLINMESLIIKGGNVSGDGGGVKLAVSGAKVRLGGGVKVIQNQATGNGGGVYVADGATLALTGSSSTPVQIGQKGDSTPTSSTTVSSSIGANKAAGYGGGIYCVGTGKLVLGLPLKEDGSVIPSSSTITGIYGGVYGNIAANGGGIYTESSFVINDGSDKANYDIANNYATQSGGGIYCNAADCTILGGKIYSNNAQNGGAVYIPTGKKLTVSSGTYTLNTATASGTTVANGGAFYNEGTLIFDGGTGSNAITIGSSGALNTCKSNGGAIYNAGSLSMAKVTVYAGTGVTTGVTVNDIYLPKHKYITLKTGFAPSSATYAPKISLDTSSDAYWAFAQILRKDEGATSLPSNYTLISIASSQSSLYEINSQGCLKPKTLPYTITSTAEANDGNGILYKAAKSLKSGDNLTLITEQTITLQTSFAVPVGATMTLQRSTNTSKTVNTSSDGYLIKATSWRAIGDEYGCGQFILDGKNVQCYSALMYCGDGCSFYNVTFQNNNSTKSGGSGNDGLGGAIIADGWEDNIKLNSCVIDNCKAVKGGAIYNGRADHITIDEATVIKNCDATTQGSVMYLNILGGDPKIKLYHSSYQGKGNTAQSASTGIKCIYVKVAASYCYIYFDGAETASYTPYTNEELTLN